MARLVSLALAAGSPAATNARDANTEANTLRRSREIMLDLSKSAHSNGGALRIAVHLAPDLPHRVPRSCLWLAFALALTARRAAIVETSPVKVKPLRIKMIFEEIATAKGIVIPLNRTLLMELS